MPKWLIVSDFSCDIIFNFQSQSGILKNEDDALASLVEQEKNDFNRAGLVLYACFGQVGTVQKLLSIFDSSARSVSEVGAIELNKPTIK